MVDSGNRDNWKRAGSLLALGGADGDVAPGPRDGSLLSIAEGEQKAKAREGAATRHRLARARRETQLASLDGKPDTARPGNELPQNPVEQLPREDTLPPLGGDTSEPQRGFAGILPDLGGVLRAKPTAAPLNANDASGERRSGSDDGDSFDLHWKPLIDPMKVVGGIARSKLLIASTTLTGALLGIAIALSTPKMYQAWTEMIVDPRNLKISNTELTEGGLPSDATLAIVENQVRVMTSGTVLTKVVQKLNLADDPEFNGQGSGGFGFGGITSTIRSILSRDDGAAGGGEDNRHALAVANLAESLTVERGGKTFVITVGATTQDGEKSALIANTMTEVFLQTYGEIQSGTAGRATGELTGRLDEMRAAVEAAERKVDAFKAENDLIDAQGRLITDDEILRLNDQLSSARARTLELNARAASARSVAVDSVLSGTLPEAVNSAAITEARAQYAVLKQEADRLAVRLGPRHPERLAVEAQLGGARERINVELRRVVASIQVELKRAVQLEQELAGRLAQLKVRQGDVSNELVTLRELERDASAKRSVYEAFLLRARETGEQKDINSANITVISKAYPPLHANPPSRATIALTGMVLGFLTGVGLGAMRGAYESLQDTANRRQRSRSRSDSRSRSARLPNRRGGENLPEAATPPAAPIASRDAFVDPVANGHYGAADHMMDGRSAASSEPAPSAGRHDASPSQANALPPHAQNSAFAPPHQAYAAPGYPAHMPQQMVYGMPHPQQQNGHVQAPVLYAWQPVGMGTAAMPQVAPEPLKPDVATIAEKDIAAERQEQIEEIRDSLREFRAAVKDLTESRTRRRYF